ncbi:hypothetical protein WA026_012383 [Henosepilachna vigintioctopunctata]|uniref:Uncharacterized protein n=1 Tax=Henosepilachna vigintioctopunctata TaxID=420089 RepID=A0AAW1UR38_9CUCU
MKVQSFEEIQVLCMFLVRSFIQWCQENELIINIDNINTPIAEVSTIDPCTSNTTEVSIKLPVRSTSRVSTDNPCSSNITCAIISEQPEHGVVNTECNAIKEITPQSDENDTSWTIVES